MFKPLQLYIGLRYTQAKRKNHFISFISFISILGISLGIMALITVLSVMNGFESELRQRILGMASHATISGLHGKLYDWEKMAALANRHPEVIASSPYVKGEVMLVNRKSVSGSLIRGILPELEPKVSPLVGHLKQGQLTDLVAGGYGIILGVDLAKALHLRLGDKVTLISPDASITPTGILPRHKRFTVLGIFEAGMYEYDRGLALIHLQDGQKLFRLGKNVTGLRLKLKDLFLAPKVSVELAEKLPGSQRVFDWSRRHANFFHAIQTEKRVMFVILLLIVAVAVFNIVSTLVMVVTDKQREIAILRTLGVSPTGIMGIFMVQGAVIGLVGTLLGILGGVVLALNVEQVVALIESSFHVEFLPADIYYISKLPSELHWQDVAKIGGIAWLLTFVATIYPALQAASTQPAEALRYE